MAREWAALLPEGVDIALLTSSTPARERRRILEALGSGPPAGVDLLIGTHSLVGGAVDVPRLALAVVDEQHRFGVDQRALLTRKNTARSPHMLMMSATPIPRSLAMILHGDLDFTKIDEVCSTVLRCCVLRRSRPARRSPRGGRLSRRRWFGPRRPRGPA